MVYMLLYGIINGCSQWFEVLVLSLARVSDACHFKFITIKTYLKKSHTFTNKKYGAYSSHGIKNSLKIEKPDFCFFHAPIKNSLPHIRVRPVSVTPQCRLSSVSKSYISAYKALYKPFISITYCEESLFPIK
jgi:hypothetical protein